MSDIDKELLKGSTTLMVLAILAEGELYGYALIKELEARSEQALCLGEGTVYPLLRSLEGRGAVAARWGSAGGRRRRYYRLTDGGHELLQSKRVEWRRFASLVDSVIGARAEQGGHR